MTSTIISKIFITAAVGLEKTKLVKKIKKFVLLVGGCCATIRDQDQNYEVPDCLNLVIIANHEVLEATGLVRIQLEG